MGDGVSKKGMNICRGKVRVGFPAVRGPRTERKRKHKSDGHRKDDP